jgi:all-trans-retinol 13,14-reductase
MAKRAVVIGTGAGGLTASVALAQEGFEVVALERGKQLGGFLNPFARRHYHFDPGVHYVGQAAPGEALHRVLRRVGLDAAELFCPMDPDGFDVLRFPDFELAIPKGLDRFRDRIVAALPGGPARDRRVHPEAARPARADQWQWPRPTPPHGPAHRGALVPAHLR